MIATVTHRVHGLAQAGRRRQSPTDSRDVYLGGAALPRAFAPRPSLFKAVPQPPASFGVRQNSDGSWNIVDPQGQKFFACGVNCVLAKDDGPPGPKYDGLSHNEGDFGKWSQATLDRLKSWNVNTIGGWSTLRGMPYTVVLPLTMDWWMENVMGDDLEARVRANAANAVQWAGAPDYATLNQDSQVLGYFTDNELKWGWEYSWKKPDSESLFEHHAAMKPDSVGKKAWAAYMVEAYQGDFERLSKTWNVDVKSADDLLAVTKIAPRTEADFAEAQRVGDEFLRRAAERYYSTTSRVMKELLPDKMNLGSRITFGFPKVLAQVCGKYNDIISLNVYQKDMELFRNEVTRLNEASGKPVMLTEFSFPAKENRSGNDNHWYEQCQVKDDRERAATFKQAADMLSSQPFVVGYHWFQYFDEPTNGRWDGENSNFGLVDINDLPYDDLTASVTQANRDAQARALARGEGSAAASAQ